MKILLVNPPNSGKSIPEEEYGIESIKMIFRGEPLSLETLAGNLTGIDQGHDVEILDLKVDPDALSDTLSRFQPDLAGITGVTCEANAVLGIARQIKDHKDIPVVAGGPQSSGEPEYFNVRDIDYVVIGLGTHTFKELVKAIETGKQAAIPGTAKTDPGSRLRLYPKSFSTLDLADDASPRYDLVEKYRSNYVMGGIGAKVGFVATAFGCTHCCTFCCIPNMTGAKYLTHSIESIIRNMNMLDDIPVIRFVDANTFGRIREAEQLALAILENNIRKKIIADIRADTVVKHPDLIRLWQKAGLSVVVIGFEDIQDEVLAQYGKHSNVKTHIQALQLLKDMHITVIGDFIVSPSYDHGDFDNLDRFISTHEIGLPMPSVLTPIPGTPLYESMKDRIENHDLDYYTFSNAVLPTKLDQKEFYTRYADLMKRFHAHVTNSQTSK